MAITVHITDDTEPDLQSTVLASIEDDGFYWSLHDAFEQIRDRTGEFVEIAGEAVFHGRKLDVLKEELRLTYKALRDGPDHLDVVIATTKSRARRRSAIRKHYDTIDSKELLGLVKTLISLATEARESGRYLVFRGD